MAFNNSYSLTLEWGEKICNLFDSVVVDSRVRQVEEIEELARLTGVKPHNTKEVGLRILHCSVNKKHLRSLFSLYTNFPINLHVHHPTHALSSLYGGILSQANEMTN